MTSPDWAATLREDIGALADILLADESAHASEQDDDPTSGVPDQAGSLRIRAFLILSHAAIEELFEQQIYETVKGCVECFDQAPPAVALALATKYSGEIIGQNSGKVPSAIEIARKLSGLYFSKVIKPNNGIRRSAIDGMCKPLGVSVGDLGTDVEAGLAQLDTLGAKRGSAAHTLRGTTEEVILESDARTWVNEAMDAVEIVIPRILEAIGQRELSQETP
ncbi:hypothetical protein [Geodermatophilus sp. URMC 60]